MDIKVTGVKIMNTLKRYRIVAIIFAIGIVLLLLPTHTKPATDTSCEPVALQELTTEQKL